MAIKPITNKQVVSTSGINRGKQISQRSVTQGNDRKSVNPGRDFTKNYSVTLKDIDTSVLTHMKNIMKPTIREANENIKVPILWGNEERWKNVRDRGVLRDKNGVIILPLIVVRRTDVVMNPEMPLSFDHDVKGEHIKVVRSSGWSKKNKYDNFAVQTGKQPVYESLTTGMPDFIQLTYQMIILTNYMEHMNQINELFLEHLETYWGDNNEYKFLSSLDGSISDATEMTADGERLIRNEITIGIKGYVLPEFTDNVYGKTAELQRILSPSKVVFDYEGGEKGTDVTPQQVDVKPLPQKKSIFGPKR